MPMVFVESYREWNERHGGNPVLELNPATGKKTGWRIWPDGATCRDEDFEHRLDVPDDPVELLRRKRNYHWTRHHLMVAEFTGAKDGLRMQAQLAQQFPNLPQPTQHDIESLKVFAVKIAKEMDLVKAAEAAIYHSPEERQKRERERFREELEHNRYMQLNEFKVNLAKLDIPYPEKKDVSEMSDEELAAEVAKHRKGSKSRPNIPTHKMVDSTTEPGKFHVERTTLDDLLAMKDPNDSSSPEK